MHCRERADRQEPVDHRHVDLALLVAGRVEHPQPGQKAQLDRLLGQRIRAGNDGLRGDDGGHSGERHHRIMRPSRCEQVKRVLDRVRDRQEAARPGRNNSAPEPATRREPAEPDRQRPKWPISAYIASPPVTARKTAPSTAKAMPGGA